MRFERVTSVAALAALAGTDRSKVLAIAKCPDPVSWGQEFTQLRVVGTDASRPPVAVEVEWVSADGESEVSLAVPYSDGAWAFDEGGPSVGDEVMFYIFEVRRDG